ncbi:hypothetical protein D0469_10315 [Peribacillus saganii]|uniref:Uncharacterized protein n=1 Tax=Peribacillus saganii TaxID=2303992 RepID=A0A372LNW0_9BACI|nr:hypothetical protein [Peribacillus saganii]RFU69138.1 hypothetical protein D0469_10315 [Peribacillus saganii]
MTNKNSSGIKRGQAITFRVPSDAPDHIVRQLQKLKETEKRNFSSKIAEYVIEGVSNSYTREREMISVPLPQKLSKSQRDWLKHSHSEAMLGSILFHLLSDPLRATALLASLNSNALEIDDALYLQETPEKAIPVQSKPAIEKEEAEEQPLFSEESVDDLADFDWEQARSSYEELEEQTEPEESLDDLLGDFLAQMNK